MVELLKSNEELWDLFTKKEEYAPLILDQYKRFPYCLSRHKNILKPLVSEFLIQNGLSPEYPDGKKFAVCLTHDIEDIVCLSTFELTYEIVLLLQKMQIGKSFRMLLNHVRRKKTPFLNFAQIMNLEKKYGAKSSFYFLALERSDRDFEYRIEKLKNEIKNIIDNGWEVGLHGGHEAYNNLDVIKKEKERLENTSGKEVIGYRNHFLKFEIPTTWKLLKEAGFKYDTTFGYADCVGFRNGMCHPFKPFDLNTNERIDLLEIPLVVMDGTLVNYMRLDWKSSWEITKLLIDTVEKYNGVITILWHNSYMVGEMLKFYEDILRYCHERNAWLTSGEEIWKWWSKNTFQI